MLSYYTVCQNSKLYLEKTANGLSMPTGGVHHVPRLAAWLAGSNVKCSAELNKKLCDFFYKLRTMIALSPEQRLACQRTYA